MAPLAERGLRVVTDLEERRRLKVRATLWSAATVFLFTIGIIGALEVPHPWAGRAVIYLLVAMYVAFIGQAQERAHSAADQEPVVIAARSMALLRYQEWAALGSCTNAIRAEPTTVSRVRRSE